MPNAQRKQELALFAKSAGIKFKKPELLELALIHRSASNEIAVYAYSGLPRYNNERLEFLGDAILGAVAAALLYSRFPEKSEGELAKIKGTVVSEEILAGLALELRLDRLLVLGKGEEQSGGRSKRAILADALEALIGALYLDSGFPAAQRFVAARLSGEITRVLEDKGLRDYKSLLQEFSQRRYKSCPVYRLVNRTGPEHERVFLMEVKVGEDVYGPCMGRNKKNAEQNAAKAALEALESQKMR